MKELTHSVGGAKSMGREIKSGKYRHFKGMEYEVLYVAKHSETLEDMVVYRALYGDGGIWVRPASMWSEKVYKDGRTVPRFAPIDDVQQGQQYKTPDNPYRSMGRPQVQVYKIIDAIQIAFPGCEDYYDLLMEEVINVDEAGMVGSDLFEDIYAADPDRYVKLPSAEEVGDEVFMARFIENELPFGTLRQTFMELLEEHPVNIFSKFKEMLVELEISQLWYDYQEMAFMSAAAAWCDDNDLDYL